MKDAQNQLMLLTFDITILRIIAGNLEQWNANSFSGAIQCIERELSETCSDWTLQLRHSEWRPSLSLLNRFEN